MAQQGRGFTKKSKDYITQHAEQVRFMRILQEAQQLRWKKNLDYGSAYRSHGSFGVAVRMTDKMMRINNLLKKESMVKENLRETAMDLLNYTGMFILLLDEEKNANIHTKQG